MRKYICVLIYMFSFSSCKNIPKSTSVLSHRLSPDHLMLSAHYLMRPWMERYNQYTGEVEKANSIKDVKEKISALEKAENSYDMWMDMFPSQVEPFYLGLQKQFDDFSDYVGLNPKNEE